MEHAVRGKRKRRNEYRRLYRSAAQEDTIPVWASSALQALSANQIHLSAEPLTRAQAADALYQTVQLKNADSGMFAQ